MLGGMHLVKAARTAVAACAVLLSLSACANAESAKPEEKVFPFSGTTLDVAAHDTPTDLVATDREDVKVTLWFDVKGTNATSHSSLKNGRLDLKAGCSGLAFCDAKFRVEVPRGVKVLRDGRKTDLR